MRLNLISNKYAMVRTVIFDFDGTIADTLESVVRIVNNNAEHFGYKRVTKEDIPYLQGKKPREILSYLGISIFKLPLWIKRIHSEMNKEISGLKPTVNILPILSEMHASGNFYLGILTSNTQENVSLFLSNNNMDLFDFITTGKSVFGKSHLINKIIKQNCLDKNEIFYVCDEVRDIEAAKKSGIKSIAVTWGYNSENALQKENPYHIAYSPDDLKEILLKH